ncbi:hypothetical protein DFJ77DRAFT_466546 [Powellomyces hirtus]|nr:hypothetical protein DFJ77DRAFT_466546 [Powellomyces hirtus]
MASLVPQRLKQQRKAGSWPLLPRKYIEGQSVSLSDLPEEVLEIIFLHVQDPSKLVRGCRSLHGVGNKALVRVRWLLARWGRANAFQGALRWTKILDSETLELLLKAVPVVPRYIIQRALTRFQHVNKADLIAPLMTYGLTHYHNLSLHKHDGQCFKDLLPFASSSLLQQMTFFTQTRLDVIDELVNVYNFNVNFCKWNPNTGLPMMATNEGDGFDSMGHTIEPASDICID